MKKAKTWRGQRETLPFLLLLTFLMIIPGFTQSQPVTERVAREVRLDGIQDRPFFFKPFTLLLSPAGILVSESGENCLKLVGTDGRLKTTIGKQGQGPDEFDTPLGLDIHDSKIYVADSFNRQVKIFSLEGKLLGNFRVEVDPVHLAVLNSERIVVSNRPLPLGKKETILYCYDSRGGLKWQAIDPLPSADQVYFTLINEIFLKRDDRGNIFIFHKYNGPQILKIDSEGKVREQIKLDPSCPVKSVELPLKSEKKRVGVAFWNVACSGDKFYLLVPDSDSRGDLGPGKEVCVIDQKGKLLEKIRFPQAIRLLATDGVTFYVLNTDDELFVYRVGP